VQIITAVTATPVGNTVREICTEALNDQARQRTQKLSEPRRCVCITGVLVGILQEYLENLIFGKYIRPERHGLGSYRKSCFAGIASDKE